MIDLEAFRKEIENIYSEKVERMVGSLDENIVKKHEARMKLEREPVVIQISQIQRA